MSNNVDRPPKSSRIRDPNRGSTEKFRPTGPTSSYSLAAHPEVAMSHQQNRRKIQENISRITFQIFLQNLVNDLKGRNHHKTTFPVKISV